MRRGWMVGVILGKDGWVEGDFTWDSGCCPGLFRMNGFGQICRHRSGGKKRRGMWAYAGFGRGKLAGVVVCLTFRKLDWLLMGWKASARGVGWDMMMKKSKEIGVMLLVFWKLA